MQFINTLQGTKDCPVSGNRLPLILVATAGAAGSVAHDDVAQALADAGFVVAAINYPGDNGADRSKSNSLSIIASRPADTIRLLNFMLDDWRDHSVIDPEQIGFFGFSAGAYTGLILAGGNPDFSKIAPICTELNRMPACEQFRSGDIPPPPPHEPRIRLCGAGRYGPEPHVFPGGIGRHSHPLADLAIGTGRGQALTRKTPRTRRTACLASPEVRIVLVTSLSCRPARRNSRPTCRVYAPMVFTGQRFIVTSTLASSDSSASISLRTTARAEWCCTGGRGVRDCPAPPEPTSGWSLRSGRPRA